MQGLNSTVRLYRSDQEADDTAGGAQKGTFMVYATGRARLQQKPATLEMRDQGLTTDKLFDATFQPANTDVLAMDMLIPLDGPWANVRFLVTAVIKPGLAHLQSPMAHLKLQLERWDDGRMIDVQ